MATAADVRALEADCPWLRDDFRADLAALSASTADEARRMAADAVVLARLASQVPRCAFDESGGTPWTSFRREVAVARTLSDRAAADEIRRARMLTQVLPQVMALLQAGTITAQRARTFVDAVSHDDDELGRVIDVELAQRVAGLPPYRIEQEVQRLAAALDAEAAALRAASKNAGRDVSLVPQPDDQAGVWINGPAVPLTRWFATLDARARTLKAGGDPRTLAQLRFDLATSAMPCDTHPPSDPTHPDATSAGRRADAGMTSPAPGADGSAGLRPSFVEAASSDCRRSRPVQAHVTVPVETSLGLSNEPGWLDGYGWLSAPTCRLLLVDAELRRVCVQSGTGQLVEVDDSDVRPPPDATGVRQSLLDMVLEPAMLSGSSPAVRHEAEHDPSPPLRDLVCLRDRSCDGPTGARTSARRIDLDHETPYPHGPTAAWNLVARSRRTHQLKHYGWTPLRTATSTIWFSPAGQVVETPRRQQPPPGVDDGDHLRPRLPDPDDLAVLDRAQLGEGPDVGNRPLLPPEEHPPF